VKLEQVIDVESGQMDSWWGSYHSAFGPLEAMSSCRQSFSREEFVAVMVNPKAEKFVALTDDGGLIGLAIVVPPSELTWISPGFYAERFPGRDVRYYGAIHVDPAHQGGRHFFDFCKWLAKMESERGSVVAYDVAAFNEVVTKVVVAAFEAAEAVFEHQVVSTQEYHVIDVKA